MKRVYKLEVEVTLEEAEEQKAIQVARDRYLSRRGKTTAPVDDPGQIWRDIPAEQAVSDALEAIMELVGSDPGLDEAGIEVVSLSSEEAKSKILDSEYSTNSAVPPETENSQIGHHDDFELDEFETGMYLCRWPNGEFSLVKAETQRDALVQLDEWAGAHPSFLAPLYTCMVDFRLNDRGEIELNEFGEETERVVWEHCYPGLNRILSNPKLALTGNRKHDREAKNQIRRAVRHERTRLWKNQLESPPAKTDAGRRFQEQMRTVGPVADYYIEQTAKEILESEAGENGKPN
jgi:hypothetical protein